MNGDQETKFVIPMTPLARFGMSFNEDLKRESDGRLLGLHEKYIERTKFAEIKWHGLFKSAFVVDAALSFLITGHDFKIPFFEIRAIEIPSIVEAVTLVSAFSVVILVLQFVTWAAYDSILRQYGNAVAGTKYSASEGDKPTVDPDFVVAAETHTEFAVKLLRAKLNIVGSDYYEPGRWFRVYSLVVFGLIALLFILFPLVHWLLTAYSLYASYSVHGFGIATVVYFAIVIAMNLLAILIAVGTYVEFEFSSDFAKQPWNS